MFFKFALSILICCDYLNGTVLPNWEDVKEERIAERAVYEPLN